MTGDDDNLPGMIGRHPAMRQVYRLVRRVAPTDLPVVIVGETGTGKELVARALHALGPHPDGPFVALNCAAIPESLAEAELFGSERGAFTGALRAMPGLLEAAHGGTLFLDEACSLPLAIQAKLLRAVEGQGFLRVGSRAPSCPRFRLVAALSTPLEQLIARGELRIDLAHRLNGVTASLLPLRYRGADIFRLAAHFLTEQQSHINGRTPRRLDPTALRLLRTYAWPGNVRELRMVIERVCALCDRAQLTAADLVAQLPTAPRRVKSVDDLEDVLQTHAWNVTEAAAALGLSRSQLHRRNASAGLARPEVARPQ